MSKFLALLLTSLLVALAYGAEGDAYVYRVSNGYNNEVRGKVSYRVEKAQGNRVETSVSPDNPASGSARTEVSGKDGNWIRRALASHDRLRDFEFAQPLPVYTPPAAGAEGAWSTRVDAVDTTTGRHNSIRVDAEILGNERITVPAGTFDTIKIRRYTYLGDWDMFMREPRIEDTDWYVPALGRPVRSETKSTWQDTSRCVRGGCPTFRGDWNVSELVELTPGRP